jgi:hypothetical protein
MMPPIIVLVVIVEEKAGEAGVMVDTVEEKT